MKLEIITGIHSKKRTKENKLPYGQNTLIKIDGKPISDNINYFYMEIRAGEPVIWQMGLIDENRDLKNSKWFLPRIWYKLKNL